MTTNDLKEAIRSQKFTFNVRLWDTDDNVSAIKVKDIAEEIETYGDDSIKIIICQLTVHHPVAFLLNCSEIPNSCLISATGTSGIFFKDCFLFFFSIV